jgi:hypothetical protein
LPNPERSKAKPTEEEGWHAALDQIRAANVDASHSAYDNHPIVEPDEWGNLAVFCSATAAT